MVRVLKGIHQVIIILSFCSWSTWCPLNPLSVFKSIFIASSVFSICQAGSMGRNRYRPDLPSYLYGSNLLQIWVISTDFQSFLQFSRPGFRENLCTRICLLPHCTAVCHSLCNSQLTSVSHQNSHWSGLSTARFDVASQYSGVWMLDFEISLELSRSFIKSIRIL